MIHNWRLATFSNFLQIGRVLAEFSTNREMKITENYVNTSLY